VTGGSLRGLANSWLALKPGNRWSSGLPLIANERVRVMLVGEVLSKDSRSPLTVSFGWFGRGSIAES